MHKNLQAVLHALGWLFDAKIERTMDSTVPRKAIVEFLSGKVDAPFDVLLETIQQTSAK